MSPPSDVVPILPINESLISQAAVDQNLFRLQALNMSHETCQRCGSKLAPIQITIHDEHRVAVAKLLGINYSVGAGSGIWLPATLCLNCGQIQ